MGAIAETIQKTIDEAGIEKARLIMRNMSGEGQWDSAKKASVSLVMILKIPKNECMYRPRNSVG